MHDPEKRDPPLECLPGGIVCAPIFRRSCWCTTQSVCQLLIVNPFLLPIIQHDWRATWIVTQKIASSENFESKRVHHGNLQLFARILVGFPIAEFRDPVA